MFEFGSKSSYVAIKLRSTSCITFQTQWPVVRVLY